MNREDLRRRLRDAVPERVRLELRLLENNLNALVKPASPVVHLSVKRLAEHLYRVSDGDLEMYVPSFARWWRYRQGILVQREELASTYGHGRHFEIRAGDVVLDLGANVGEFSLFAASRGARVLAVEADDFVFALLTRNTAREPSITRISAAVWKEPGMVEFFSSPEGADSSTIAPDTFGVRYMKQATTLDQLLAALDAPRVKLVKCDAEGAEPEVLSGGLGMLPEKVEWLAFDCGPERKGQPTLEACRRLVTGMGFSVVSDADGGTRLILIARNERFSGK